MEQRSLFGLSEHLERLSKNGDPLDSSRGHAAFVEDQAVHVVGDVDERQFGLGMSPPENGSKIPEIATDRRAGANAAPELRIQVVIRRRSSSCCGCPADIGRTPAVAIIPQAADRKLM